MESVRERSTWFESSPAMLLERDHQDSQSPCSSGILQVRMGSKRFIRGCCKYQIPFSILTAPWPPSAEVPMIELDLSVKNGVVIRAGENLRLPATVTGKPYPSIAWTKDDGKPDKDHVEILTEGNNSIVAIKNIQRKDCGKYQITACNPSGTKSAATRVEVMGEWNPQEITVGKPSGNIEYRYTFFSADVPGPVTDLKPVVVTRKMIFLNWDDPEDDGGSDLTGFIVERRDAKMHTWRQPVETASSKCECVGIMEGQDYMFRVIAKNKYGMGPPVELGPIKAVDPQGES